MENIEVFYFFQIPKDEKKSGILRVDVTAATVSSIAGSAASSSGTKGRKSSKSSLSAIEPTSPAPSADRLSVTFAMDDGNHKCLCSILLY